MPRAKPSRRTTNRATTFHMGSGLAIQQFPGCRGWWRCVIARPEPMWKVVALFVVLLLGFALGIWGTYRAVYPEKGVHRLTAVFQARAGDTAILVRHEAAPALSMGSMELMAFDLESKALLDQAGLKPGDRVRLTIRQTPDRLLVVRIDRLP